jgi:hypothetical protein
MLPKSIRELDLSNNPNIHNEAYKIISDNILENIHYKLERLILEGCKINDEGVSIISKSLEYNNTLKYMNLSRNNI